jgi:hypothetical protein
MNSMIRAALAAQLQDALFTQIGLSQRLAILITGKPIEPRKLAECLERDLGEQIALLSSAASVYGAEDLDDRIEIAKSVVGDIVRELRKT